jgi:hypothetical protein
VRRDLLDELDVVVALDLQHALAILLRGVDLMITPVRDVLSGGG